MRSTLPRLSGMKHVLLAGAECWLLRMTIPTRQHDQTKQHGQLSWLQFDRKREHTLWIEHS